MKLKHTDKMAFLNKIYFIVHQNYYTPLIFLNLGTTAVL